MKRDYYTLVCVVLTCLISIHTIINRATRNNVNHSIILDDRHKGIVIYNVETGKDLYDKYNLGDTIKLVDL